MVLAAMTVPARWLRPLKCQLFCGGSRIVAVPWCARRLTALPPHALRRSCTYQPTALEISDDHDRGRPAPPPGRSHPRYPPSSPTPGHSPNSGLLPASYRKNPANVLWAMEYGEMLGLVPDGHHDRRPRHRRQADRQRRAHLRPRPPSRPQAPRRGDGKSATCEIIRSDEPKHVFSVTWTLKKDRQQPQRRRGQAARQGRYGRSTRRRC